MATIVHLSSIGRNVRLQDDEETFTQPEVSLDEYFPSPRSKKKDIGARSWFIEREAGTISLLRIRDGARKRYKNEWNETGTVFLHRLPTMGREYKLLNAQYKLDITHRHPFKVIRCIGSSAYDFGVFLLQDRAEDGRGFIMRRIVPHTDDDESKGKVCGKKRQFAAMKRGNAVCAHRSGEYSPVEAVPPTPPPPTKKKARDIPEFVSSITQAPVKSSSEGRHLNWLRAIFGEENVHYEPCAFKVLNRPRRMGGHVIQYTPDFLVNHEGKHVFIESKSSMSDVSLSAIAKASGVKKYGFQVYFLVGPPCDIQCWRVNSDESISPSNIEMIGAE